MGRPIKEFKKKDLHISLDYDLYIRLMEYFELNKSIRKSELISNLIELFLKDKDL